jgi:hypothetical protein
VVRKSGGLSAKEPDMAAVRAYLEKVSIPTAIEQVATRGQSVGGHRALFLEGLAESLSVMWDLAREAMGDGDPVPYERSVRASTATGPTPSEPTAKRERLGALLAEAGYPANNSDDLLGAVDAWRKARVTPAPSIPALARAFIAELEAGTVRHVMPHLPEALGGVPRSNVTFLPIEDAWFSGSMNYIGRARTEAGLPEYEATYELNASLEISVPEFHNLVSHEVVPGHVTTFAYVQHLHLLGEVGFEGTVLTMNSRYSTLAEGIANNALLMAHGIADLSDVPDADLQMGVLLSHLQDDAKNQASYLTWHEKVEQKEVAAVLRRDYLVSEERAEKLSGPWANHPLMGRMYLPSYRVGTERVAGWLKKYPPKVVIPTLFGCHGLVDIVTIETVLDDVATR